MEVLPLQSPGLDGQKHRKYINRTIIRKGKNELNSRLIV